jgi:hypothetical protein
MSPEDRESSSLFRETQVTLVRSDGGSLGQFRQRLPVVPSLVMACAGAQAAF